MSALRLAFMGSAPFAVPALDALCRAGHRIAAVYSRPPRPVGRGARLRRTPLHMRAGELALPVETPDSLNDPETRSALARLDLDVAVVAAYGLLVPRAVLDTPRRGCVNLHPSLLPRWRGATPAAHAVLHGDTVSGATVMQMDEGLDTGAVLAQRSLPVPPRATAGELEAALADLGATMLVDVLGDLERAQAAARPQNDADATLAPRFAREDGRIDWARPATEIDRLVRGLAPWPGAFFALGATTVKVTEAEPVRGAGAPGTLLEREMTVACGEGALRLVRVKAAGRAETGGAAFLRGLRLSPGAVLA